jgi:alkane 1-monooxygenase
VGMCYMLGVLATSNINVAHELVHKDNKLDQVLGMLTLSKNLYMHFYIQHIKVHHKHVATPLDPSTAKLN